MAVWALFAAFTYLTSAPQAIASFQHVGYPQQLRVLLGIAKAAGAVTLVVPQLPTLKEWAYAGFTFTWIAATVAHYLAGDGALVFLPLGFLTLLWVSYLTRPANRRLVLSARDAGLPRDATSAFGRVAS